MEREDIMIRRLYVAAAAWATVGLLGGLYYRTLTHQQGFEGGMGTQLAVVHTHALALGALWLLVVMALARAFQLENLAGLNQFFVAWNAGLALTVGSLVAKGTMQVLGGGDPESKALTGISGLGHVILTVAMILLFMALAKALPARTGAGDVAAAGAMGTTGGAGLGGADRLADQRGR